MLHNQSFTSFISSSSDDRYSSSGVDIFIDPVVGCPDNVRVHPQRNSKGSWIIMLTLIITIIDIIDGWIVLWMNENSDSVRVHTRKNSQNKRGYRLMEI